MAGVSWAGLVIALDPSPLAQGGDHPLVWIAVGSITLFATGLVTITFGPIKPAAFSLTGAFLASLLIATVLDPTPIPLIAIAAIAPALLGALGYGFMAAAQTEHEARLVIENKALNARLVSSLERADNLVRRDPMTGLFNRRVLFSDFKNAPSLGEVRTFIQIDLDQFRLVNSRFGQDVGDSILRGLAREMEGVCKSLGHGKFACVRLGGEEFAIMLDQMDMRTGEALAYGLRERIPAIPSPAELRMGLKVSASFSIAEQRPKEALADLLRRSDEAMQRAKACGGGSLAPAE
jgi:diguanylate cyclase (GGDEF)-like protein